MGNQNKPHSPFGWLHVAEIYAPAVAPLFSHSSPGHASRFEMNDCRSLSFMVSLTARRHKKCVKCFAPCMEMLFRAMTACSEQVG